MENDYDIVVIGGGVMGCSIALECARAGRRALVVDKGPAAGAGSTSASSAIIRFHYSTLDAVIVSWEAMHYWARWNEHVGADEAGMARFYQPGMLVLESPAAERKRTVLDLFDVVGVPYEELDPTEVRERFPAVDTASYWPPKAVSNDAFWNDGDGETLAYFTPDAGFVDDPQLAAHNFMNAATRAGATFAFRTSVDGIETAGSRTTGVRLGNGDVVQAPVVVNASGPYSSKINEMAGVLDDFKTITTRALRQEVHVVESPPDYQLERGAVGVNDTDLGIYFRPQPGGSVVVGGLEPDCDPLVFVDDPDTYDEHASVAVWEAQVYRLARRLPSLAVPSRPVGLGALYDVTPDWVPVYDRTSLDGYYVAIGTSGNQFKNAPMVGRIMSTLIDACEQGHDHDKAAVHMACEHTRHELNLGHFSRLRVPADTTHSVLG